MWLTDGRTRYISEEFLATMVILLALGVRILHVVFTASLNPLAGDLTLDSAIYDRWAKSLVWGGDAPVTQYMQAPLYPWFVSLVYRVFGPSLTAVRAAQALLGVFTCGFVITITRRLLHSSTAGIAAGLIAALYLPAIFYEGVLLPATLVLFLNSLFVVLMTHDRGYAGMLRCTVAGFVLGLSVLAWPVALMFIPFALLHLATARRTAQSPATPEFPASSDAPASAYPPAPPGSLAPPEPQRSAEREAPPATPLVRRAGALLAGLVIALAPLAMRNARTTGGLVPVTTGGGINFYIGNNPAANGFYAVPLYEGLSLGGTPEEQHLMMHEIAGRKLGHEPSASEVSRFWFSAGLGWIRSDPGAWLSLTWRKFLYFLNRYERSNVESMAFHRRFGGILSLPLPGFWLASSLGLLGIFLARSRWRQLWLLYGGVLAYLATALLFYVLSRYRLPVIVFLIPFAGAAVAELLKMVRDRKLIDFALMTGAFALLLYLTGMTLAKDTPVSQANNLVRLGRVYWEQGDNARAQDALREALASDPSNDAARRLLERMD